MSPALALVMDARDPGRVAEFWAALLDREAVADGRGILLPGSDTQVGLRFVHSDSEQVGESSVHLHVTSSSDADQEATVAAALALGGRHLDVGQLPEEGHVVLADTGGNAFCVIEAGNSFLAGCGRLGELACDGSRAVGLFWAEALGWPLVWDHDEETAVQSPCGGTKVAWGGPTEDPDRGRNRQRLDLTVGDGDGDGGSGLDAAVRRLVALGARRLGDTGDGGVELADPDGNEFRVG